MNSEKKLSLTRLAQGVALGAVATLIIGFAWGGWYTTSSAETLAKNEARAEVVRVLAPICLSQFDAKPEAVMIKADLGSKSAYQLKSDLEKIGVATMPGSEKPEAGVAQACAELVLAAAKK